MAEATCHEFKCQYTGNLEKYPCVKQEYMNKMSKRILDLETARQKESAARQKESSQKKSSARR